MKVDRSERRQALKPKDASQFEITATLRLHQATLKWEVALIEWSVEPKTKEEAYFWALDVCKTFQMDISVKPKITDYYEGLWYECTFLTAGREFTVSSFYAKSVKLSYTKELHEKKQASIEKIIRKLQAANMRPY